MEKNWEKFEKNLIEFDKIGWIWKRLKKNGNK